MISKHKHKRSENVFWKRPVQYTLGAIAIPIPPASDAQEPLYWIDNRLGELLFINSSDEVLKLVSSVTGGFDTADDDILTLSNSTGYSYRNIKPNEGVKIEEFQPQSDSDFIFQVTIQVQSETQGSCMIILPPEKGDIPTQVLLWKNKELGKNISIKWLD